MYDLAAVAVFVTAFALLFVLVWALARLWAPRTHSASRSRWPSLSISSTRCSAGSGS